MKRSLAVLTAALVLFIAGCSNSGDDASDPENSTASSDAEAADEPGSADSDNLIGRMTAALEEAGSMYLEMTATGGTGSDAGDVTMTGAQIMGDSLEDNLMDMTMSVMGMQTQIILVDSVIYMNYGTQSNNQFVTVDLNDENDEIAAGVAPLLESMDGSASFEGLEDAVISIEQAGESLELDGVETTRYEVILDTAELPNVGELEGADAIELPDQVTYVYYVGPDDLPRRVEFELAGVTTTQDMSRFGEDFEITAPPADQIMEMAP